MRVRNMNNNTNKSTTTTTQIQQQQQSQDDSLLSSPNSSSINSSCDNNNKNIFNNFMAPPIGGTVKCTTCLGNIIQGKVMAYDQQTKMLVLRTYVHGKSGHNDISIVNVQWCKDLEVIEEPNEPPEQLAPLNLQKLERRTRLNIDKKSKEINSLGNGVSVLAQHLYFTILKTISEVDWNGEKIVVMDAVVIEPPYTAESCSNKGADSRALEHVKKIVAKFNDDYKTHQHVQQIQQQQQQPQQDSPLSPPSSPSTNENNKKLPTTTTTTNQQQKSSTPPPPPSTD